MTQYWMEHQRSSQAGCVSCTHLQSLFFFLTRHQILKPIHMSVGRVWDSSYLHRSSHHMSDRPSHGIRIAVHRMFQVLWPGICKSRTHTRLFHYISTRRRSDSASVMILGRSYTLHPPACKTQERSVTPVTFAFYIKPLFFPCRWTYARCWMGGWWFAILLFTSNDNQTASRFLEEKSFWG